MTIFPYFTLYLPCRDILQLLIINNNEGNCDKI
jgi:hypothetical protein